MEHKRHSAWDSKGRSEGSHIVFTTERVRQRHQLQQQHKQHVNHLQTCLCFCGAAARFPSAPSSLRFSYSISSYWSTCIFSSMTKGTSFPLPMGSPQEPIWPRGGKRLTWVPVRPHRFQLMFTVSVRPCSFPLYIQLLYLTASPEVFKLSHQKLKPQPDRKLVS